MQNRHGNSPLHWAALNGHLDVIKLLIDGPAPSNGEAPFWPIDCVDQMISAKNEAGKTACDEAEEVGFAQMNAKDVNGDGDGDHVEDAPSSHALIVQYLSEKMVQIEKALRCTTSEPVDADEMSSN